MSNNQVFFREKSADGLNQVPKLTEEKKKFLQQQKDLLPIKWQKTVYQPATS
jgi:hypothetical protein